MLCRASRSFAPGPIPKLRRNARSPALAELKSLQAGRILCVNNKKLKCCRPRDRVGVGMSEQYQRHTVKILALHVTFYIPAGLVKSKVEMPARLPEECAAFLISARETGMCMPGLKACCYGMALIFKGKSFDICAALISFSPPTVPDFSISGGIFINSQLESITDLYFCVGLH